MGLFYQNNIKPIVFDTFGHHIWSNIVRWVGSDLAVLRLRGKTEELALEKMSGVLKERLVG